MRGWGKRKQQLPEFCGPVKRRPDLIGEVRNLKDPLEQDRFAAALLARKRARKGSRLSVTAATSYSRDLSEKECQAVFEAVGWKHGQGSKRKT